MITTYFSEKELRKSSLLELNGPASAASLVINLAVLLITIALIIGIVRANQLQTAVVVQENLSAFADKEEVLVILYGKESCANCKLALEELQAQDIKFVYRDIGSSSVAQEEFNNFDGNNVPMVITRYLKITGFNKEWFGRSVLVDNKLPYASRINQ